MSPDGGIHAREELVQNKIIDIYKNNVKIKTFDFSLLLVKVNLNIFLNPSLSGYLLPPSPIF